MKIILLSLLVWGLAGCSPREEAGEDQDDVGAAAPAGEGVEGTVSAEDLSAWSIQLDDPAGDVGGFQLMVQDNTLNVTTGPAGIAWRPVDLVMGGDFTASATFSERSVAPGSTEAYGIFVGGKNLDAPDLQYTYFLVRSTGEYLIKRRDGEQTIVLVDWSGSEGAGRVETQGTQPGNTLSVEVQGEEVRFLVNGRTVETLAADVVRPHGVAGVRVNHQLDVAVSGWKLTGEQVGDATPGDLEDADEPEEERDSVRGVPGQPG